MSGILEFVTGPEFGTWLAAITGIVTAATAVTAITPTQVDNRIVGVLLTAWNFAAGNVAKNKNAEDA